MPSETTNAIAIAASLAAGTVANFGTMTKSLHAGRTAQSGVLAARLAKSGFTASPDVLEHKAGFMQSHSHAGKPAVTRGDWGSGQNWRLAKMGINIKRYPMCYATHRSIDAVLDLAGEHNLDPDAIEEIHVRIGDAQDMMLRNREPKTALEAKFSIEFAVASALVARKVGLKELDDGFVRRDDIIETMRKVKRSDHDRAHGRHATVRAGRSRQHPAQERAGDQARAGRAPEGALAEAADRGRAAREVPGLHRRAAGAKAGRGAVYKLNNLEDVTSLRELPLVKL